MMPCTATNVLAILVMFPIGAVLGLNLFVIVGILLQEIGQANYERDRTRGIDRLLGVKPSPFVEEQETIKRISRGASSARRSSVASSGMTLFTTPACKAPTVTTAAC